jgi:6-pyruvoyltetrahydropterin/6-carboxytetrahydropterin synthase
MITISRYHEIDCGHRVVNHESKCKHLHGHRYRFTFTLTAPSLDDIGRVIDFSVVKFLLCQWLEDNWDHRMLLWEHDPQLANLRRLEPASIVAVPFNPTAENLADYLLRVVGPRQLNDTGITLTSVTCQETAKCNATASL